MKKIFLIALFSVLALGFGLESAEAARFGGGRSFGMQRQAVPRQAPRQANAAQPTRAAGAPTRSWLGPLAGLAAGIGLYSLFSHLGVGQGMANILMIALFAFLAIQAVKFLLRKQALAKEGSSAGGNSFPLQKESNEQFSQGFQGTQTFQPASSASEASPADVPDGFDVDGFVRIAKRNFIRLQTSNDEKNTADIREFVSPEVFAEIKLQLDERSSAIQKTDVVTLNANLIELVTEGGQHIASVRFEGMIREEENGPALAFEEIWNLSKPVDGNQGWMVSGIQQV